MAIPWTMCFGEGINVDAFGECSDVDQLGEGSNVDPSGEGSEIAHIWGRHSPNWSKSLHSDLDQLGEYPLGEGSDVDPLGEQQCRPFEKYSNVDPLR